jgi:four helix bundle protein
MSRDHRRLRVFQEAHQLTLDIYKCTRDFPRDEWFGIRAQLRRAAVSVASNLVEGNARRSTRDYLNFLNISRGSAAEVDYLLGLSLELGFVRSAPAGGVKKRAEGLIPQLEALIRSMEILLLQESSDPQSSRARR